MALFGLSIPDALAFGLGFSARSAATNPASSARHALKIGNRYTQ